jgi:hypothetical protein
MGFLCKIEEKKFLDNPLDRDLGLSNVYNINTNTNFCLESFNGFNYTISGATKPLTGNTSPCFNTPTNCYAVYNLSENDSVTLDFILSGSTNYTGYTGSFCYKLFNRSNFTLDNPNKTLVTTTPTFTKCIDFSAITSTTINEVVSLGSLPLTDNDYMVRSYYRFLPKKCGNNILDTWLLSNQFNNFDFDHDWYFLSVTNPPKPNIINNIDNIINEVRLYQEVIPGSNYGNFLKLSNYPLDNKVNLYVNGVRLTEGIDYIVDSSLFPTTTPIINIISGNISNRDIITLTYLIGPQTFLTNFGQTKNDLFNIDTFFVTGITVDISASTVNIVNSNTIKATQEVFLTDDFDPESDIVVVVNGITLLRDVEYYKSSTVKNKIIFNPNFITINPGDILSFWYFKTKLKNNNDLGTLNTNSVRIQWSVNRLLEETYSTGEFILEVTPKTDTNWSSLFYSNTISYNTNGLNYEDIVNNLNVNVDYKFRIIFRKTYKNILNEDIITSSNVVGYFNTKNDKIIYGY